MLLESPLDKLEPYQIFSSCLMSKILLPFLVHSPPWANLAFFSSFRAATRTATVLLELVLSPVCG